MDDQGTPPPGQQVRYVLQGGNSGTPNVNPPKVSSRGGPRGGLTMQMVQQQQQHNPVRVSFSKNYIPKKVPGSL